jgi:predicted nucleic acid-binding protein
MSTRISYAWDSTTVIAWLCDEATAPLADIGLVVNEIDGDHANLILSATIHAEVLETKHTPEKFQMFKRFSRRSNVINADMTVAIAQKAARIREACLKEGRKLRTPDATILATAILYKASVLHSLDTDLLNLNGNPIVEGLPITLPLPLSGQRGLLLT